MSRYLDKDEWYNGTHLVKRIVVDVRFLTVYSNLCSTLAELDVTKEDMTSRIASEMQMGEFKGSNYELILKTEMSESDALQYFARGPN